MVNVCSQKLVLSNVDTAQIYSGWEISVLHPPVATPPEVEGNKTGISSNINAADLQR